MLTFAKDSFFAKAYPFFKWMVYGLLGMSMVFFFLEQTIVEGMESLGWLLLLLLFEWETSQMDQPYISAWEKHGIFVGRLLAYAVILHSVYEHATPAYIAEHGALDMYNAGTWLLVVLALEYDVYFPGEYHRLEWLLRNLIKSSLYIALFLYAVIWGMEGELLDFYDAVLWILCFFFIELNILRFEDDIPYAEDLEQQGEAES